MPNEIANRVRQLRSEFGLGQQELADLVGLDPQRIAEIEAAYGEPDAAEAAAIASALGATRATLLAERAVRISDGIGQVSRAGQDWFDTRIEYSLLVRYLGDMRAR
jgi:transcriptional regulator with XRE-family HTH domain